MQTQPVSDDVRVGEPLRQPAGGLPPNLVALVERSVRRSPDKVAMRWKERNRSVPGEWQSWTYAELWRRVIAVSLRLRSLGVGHGDHVVIISRSRPEWAVADLAILALGAVTCPIFHDESAMRTGQILHSVDSGVAFVEGAPEAALLAAARGGRERPQHVIAFDPGSSPDVTGSFRALATSADGDVGEDRGWRAGWEAIGTGDVATVVHTVDGAGAIHGAVLTHGNVLHNYAAVIQALPLTEDEVVLSVLPLSHVLERATGLYVPLGLGATVAYAERGGQRWTRSLLEIRPTALVGVPLLFDRLAEEITAETGRQPARVRRMVARATHAGRRHYENELNCRRDSVFLRWQLALARLLVTRPIRRRLGGRLRFFACGGAPLNPTTGAFFFALGIPIAEGYGLSETSPVLTLNRLDAPRFGTVGYPVAQTEIRIEPGSGEILARGPQVMRGYLEEPEETARVIDAQGWFHTGDAGRFDERGALVISGRIKELIVLSTGKKVSPRPMVAVLRTSPLIAEATMLGDGEPATRVVVTPDVDALQAGGAARAAGHPGDRPLGPAEVQQMVESEVEALLSDFARYERPRHVEVLSPVRRTPARGVA